jgi:hypothetical protein
MQREHASTALVDRLAAAFEVTASEFIKEGERNE